MEFDLQLEYDNLLVENQKFRRKIQLAKILLEDIPHMLDHERIEVAREYVDRAMRALEG